MPPEVNGGLTQGITPKSSLQTLTGLFHIYEANFPDTLNMQLSDINTKSTFSLLKKSELIYWIDCICFVYISDNTIADNHVALLSVYTLFVEICMWDWFLVKNIACKLSEENLSLYFSNILMANE